MESRKVFFVAQVVVSNDFFEFSPRSLGEMIQFDGSHIFQIGLKQPTTSSNSYVCPWIFLHAFNSKLHFVQALFKGKTVLDVGSGHLEQVSHVFKVVVSKMFGHVFRWVAQPNYMMYGLFTYETATL